MSVYFKEQKIYQPQNGIYTLFRTVIDFFYSTPLTVEIIFFSFSHFLCFHSSSHFFLHTKILPLRKILILFFLNIPYVMFCTIIKIYTVLRTQQQNKKYSVMAFSIKISRHNDFLENITCNYYRLCVNYTSQNFMMKTMTFHRGT